MNLSTEQLTSPYNDEPVYYCASCLSLKILNWGKNEEDELLCLNCNRTDIRQTDIHTWREMWKIKYGKYPEE